MGADISIVERMEMPDVVENKRLFDEAVRHRDSLDRQLQTKAAEEAQEKVMKLYDEMYPDDAYFRDSYNISSLFWRLGLSWWKDVGELMKKYQDPKSDPDSEEYDEDYYRGWDLPPEGIHELLKMVQTARWDLPPEGYEEFRVWCKENHAQFEEDKEDGGHQEWIDFWEEKYDRFVAMCENAIENGWHMSCSI